MKVKDIRQKTVSELSQLLSAERKSLKAFRFNISGSKTKNVREGRNRRRIIAQAETIFREKQKNG